MKIRKLKVNVAMGGAKAGDVLNLRCDDDGVPLETFWRRRVQDSAIDNCVEFVPDEQPSAAPKKKEDK